MTGPAPAKWLGWTALAAALDQERARSGGPVLFTNGCFDCLHRGHRQLLAGTRDRFSGPLVVGVNSDASVTRLKGPGRPVEPQETRLAKLAALPCVDYVTLFEEDTPEALVEFLRPEVLVKSDAYDARQLPEARCLRAWGGVVVFVPHLEGYSTTALLRERE